MRKPRSSAFLSLFLLVLFAGCGGSDPKPTTTSEISSAGPANRPATITTQEDTPSDPFTPQFQGSRGGGSPTFAIVKQPGRGLASIVNNKLIYTPDADFSGQDNFKYKATDPGGFSATGTAVVNVTAVNDAPKAAGAQRPVYAGFAGAWTPWVDDADIWDTFSYQVSTQALNGTASVVGGRLQYTPAVGFTSGTDSFAFEATDSGGAEITGTAYVRVYDADALTRCTSPGRVNPDDGMIAYLGKANPCAFYGETTTRTTLEGTPVTMDFYVLWPSNNNAPKGVVVLIGGGNLNMAITGVPGTGVADITGGANFPVRAAQLFADAGYQAVAIDRPSDQPPPGSSDSTAAVDPYRISVDHAVDILQILKHINTENRNVFLAGTSQGAVSVVANNLIATGISIASPSTTGSNMYVGRPGFPSLQPGFVQRPVHVLWHQNDLCSSFTPPAGSQALYDTLATTTDAAFNVASGGVRVTQAGFGITPNVCGTFDYHGYLGIEPTAVGYITNWLDDRVNQLAGNKPPEAAFATVATAAGVPKQVQLATLTRDPDDDPLSYALSHATTSLGGSVTLNDSMAVYTPPPGVSGKTDYFVYVVTDGKGGVAAGVITVQIDG